MGLLDGRFTINDIFEILTFVGFFYYIIKRFVLKQPPIPAAALRKIDREKLRSALALLYKNKKVPGGAYTIPPQLSGELERNLHDPELLRRLMCDIAAHVGIDGSRIKLKFKDDATLEYAGNISTNGAFTTINLQTHDYYNLDVLTAILAHEVMHLYLYYNGIRFSDTLSNEVLTDTAAVFFGFGEYLRRGYKVIEVNLGFSYHKVGYIRPEDVEFILSEIQGKKVDC